MLNRKQVKEYRKKLLEKYNETKRKETIQIIEDEFSVSSWDYVYYILKYKSK